MTTEARSGDFRLFRSKMDNRTPIPGGMGSLLPLPARLLAWLPRGRTLPEDVWWHRHRGIQILLWLHSPLIFAVAFAQDPDLVHAVLEASIPLAFALLALAAGRQNLSMVITSVGLMTCSAVFVHLTHGLIEMHFHYFVMVGVITLYQAWSPFLIAIGYVVIQHTVAGLIDPESVYNHPAAIESPLTWAVVHGAFILAMSATGAVNWRLTESLLGAAQHREHQLAEAQEIARLGSWEHDFGVNRTTWSDEMYRLFDVDGSFVPTRRNVAELIHPDDRNAWNANMDRTAVGDIPDDQDFRLHRPDGDIRWFHGHVKVTEWDEDRVAVMTGTVQDITERRRIEDDLRASRAEVLETVSRLDATLDSTADGILVVDRNGTVTGHNARFAEMWRIPADLVERGNDDELRAFVLDQLVDPGTFVAKVNDLYARPEAESLDVAIEFKDGRVFERFSRPQRVSGKIVGRVWSFRDVTGRTRLEAQLSHQALHDPLTELANQTLFRDRLDHALQRMQRQEEPIAVLFLDLDDFKNVNDSFGHTAGDDLLREVAGRIRSCLRAADTAARLGGDEFAVLLEDLVDVERAVEVAQRLLAALVDPFTVGDREVFVSASVGIAHSSSDSSPDQLLRNADLAMYAAKHSGKKRYELFAPEMHSAAIERVEIESDLRRALERDELVLDYQPIVSVDTGRIVAVEALVRWNHPERGLLAPDAFIPHAEKSDLIDGIGAWVLETACLQMRAWQLEHAHGQALSLSVNVAPRQLRDPAIVDLVTRTLERSGLSPGCLVLEITENAMMQDTELALERLTALRALGLRLAVDDFGTGHSSLSYLQQFPIDVVKIDRSFVTRIDQGAEESALGRAIVRLAGTLQLSAVAEGVETPSQLDQLRAVGCPMAQGFHLHYPTGAAAIGALLAEQGAGEEHNGADPWQAPHQ